MEQMEQQKRLMLTMVLTAVVIFGYMHFFGPKPPVETAAGPDAGAAPAAQAPAPAPGGAPAAEAAPDGGQVAAAPETAPAAPQVPVQEIAFSTAALDLRFTNQGAGLTEVLVKHGGPWPERKFLDRPEQKKEELGPVEMVHLRAGQPAFASTEIGGDLSLPAGTAWQVEKAPDGVVFRASTAELEVEKRYRVNANGWDLRVEHRITNRSGAAKKLTLSTVLPAHVDPKTEKGGSFFSPPPEIAQAICRHDKSNETFKSTEEAKQETFAGPVQFAGFDKRYFGAFAFPRFSEASSCVLSSQQPGDRTATIVADLGAVQPGQTALRELGMYLGPKSNDELERVSVASSMGASLVPVGQEPKPGEGAKIDPQLTHSIDFGWWAVICRLLLGIMKFFQSVVVNWGVAIVLLTVLVKLVLYPLSHKQMESMEAMRKLQPQLQALEKKFAGDKDKLNLEKMKLFQENKVNPFGGCLPLLVQMPVWIALYQTLLASFELYREPLLPGGVWISDLTAKDPYYILPLAMGVTMFITQKMQPTMGDPTQAKIMLYFMPILFTFMMFNLPAGLTLYIFTNNLLSIAQQKYLQHRFAKRDAALAKAKG